MDIGIVSSDGIVRFVVQATDVQSVELNDGETAIERKLGEQWGGGWSRLSDGSFLDPDGSPAPSPAPVPREISLNTFIARLPDAVVDALLDMESNPTSKEAREVRRAMLRFRSAEGQMIDLDSPLVQGFLPKLAAFGLPHEAIAALIA